MSGYRGAFGTAGLPRQAKPCLLALLLCLLCALSLPAAGTAQTDEADYPVYVL